MKKILFIIPYIPYPLDSGGNQAFFNMVDYLRHEMNVSVLLIAKNHTHEENIAELKKLWSNVTFYIYRPQTIKTAPVKIRHPFYYKWLLKAQASIARKIRRQLLQGPEPADENLDMVRLKSTLPGSIFERLSTDYIEFVMQTVKTGFDIIQVEFYELISLGYILPQENIQTVFVHHELRYIHNENEMSLFREVTDEDEMLFNIAKDFERDALKKYKHIIALTEIDRNILTKFIGREERIYASPAVVKISGNEQNEFIPSDSHRLTFVGSEDHCPNLDAVIWFCREIIPQLRRQGFKFTFQVIGKWRSTYIKELRSKYPEMELTGFVEDLRGFIKGSIALIPIRIGSGMRMKILDAVSAGVPFITTTKGVEGIDFRNDQECLIADDPTTFANAIIQLADNPTLQKNMIDNAEKRLRNIYNPQEMLHKRLEVYAEIADCNI